MSPVAAAFHDFLHGILTNKSRALRNHILRKTSATVTKEQKWATDFIAGYMPLAIGKYIELMEGLKTLHAQIEGLSDTRIDFFRNSRIKLPVVNAGN